MWVTAQGPGLVIQRPGSGNGGSAALITRSGCSCRGLEWISLLLNNGGDVLFPILMKLLSSNEGRL